MVDAQIRAKATMPETFRIAIGLAGALLILLSSLSLPAFGALVSRVDRQEISSGETLTLRVSLDQQVIFGEPDFSRLETDFEIVSRNRQSRYTSNNGQTESYTHWILTLIPRREGKLQIPGFSFKGEVSDALEITVNKPSSSLSSDARIFTETQLEKNSVYVQEQALLTLRLYTAVPLSDFASSALEVPGAQVIKLTDNQYQKRIGKMDYIVVETRYAIFPENSGELTLPGIRYSGVARLDYHRERVTLSSEEQILSVKARPGAANGGAWLPARKLGMSDNWQEQPPRLTVGEPVTRTIVVEAEGLTAAQLPPLDVGDARNIKLYRDQAQLEDSNETDGVRGRRVESMAIVPTEAGTLTLPEISLQWWDTASDSPRTAVLPARTLSVLPGAHSPASPGDNQVSPVVGTGGNNDTSPQIATGSGNATLISLLLGSNILLLVLSTGFALLWWRARAAGDAAGKRMPPEPGTRANLKAVRQAVATGDYARLREAIIHWAREHWAEPGLHTLDQVARRADDPALKPLFDQLDTLLYEKRDQHTDPESETDFEALVKRLEQVPEYAQARGKPGLQALEPLYPQ